MNKLLNISTCVEKAKLPLTLTFELRKFNSTVSVTLTNITDGYTNVEVTVNQQEAYAFEELERVAKNFYICGNKKYNLNKPKSWDTLPSHIQELYMIMAEISLEAVNFIEE